MRTGKEAERCSLAGSRQQALKGPNSVVAAHRTANYNGCLILGCMQRCEG